MLKYINSYKNYIKSYHYIEITGSVKSLVNNNSDDTHFDTEVNGFRKSRYSAK